MVYAYTNFNLGDDLFIRILFERYPYTQFYLYAPHEYKHNFNMYKNVTVYSSSNFFVRLLNYGMRKIRTDISLRTILAKKCDAIVHIGGSIFIQKDNWDGIPKYRQNLEKKPYYVLGANFGPFRDQQFYKKHYELFQGYTDVCFRDTYSYELFKDLPNVRMASDIVFQLHNKQTVPTEKHIMISVIKPSFRRDFSNYDKIYYQKIRDISIYFVKMGYRVTLMSFCENEGDKEAVEEIIRILPKQIIKKIEAYYYKSDIEEALRLIASSTYVVATRFHAMILGWVLNKPVFPIAYSEKMNNVLRDIAYKGSYINLREINNLTPLEVYEGIKTNSVDITAQAKNAENHFKKLDEYLTET
jgi:colanic acid/amylovoran biosynthesis protein